MRETFLMSTISLFLLFGLLLAIRYRTACLEDRAVAAVERLGAEGGRQ